jgi:MIP family channel proteins
MNAKSWQHFYSEFLGTFALVFVGSGAIIVASGAEGDGLLKVAVAHGLVLSIMVSAFKRISAHFNPAVTIAFLARGRIPLYMALIHIGAQVLGAVAAAFALKAAMPPSLFTAGFGGVQSVAPAIDGIQAWALEAIATFFLMSAIYGTCVDGRSPNIGGFGVGLTVAFDILMIGPLTGASMNPARTFGPMLAYGNFTGYIAIYLTAPIVGALFAAVFYEQFIMRADQEPTVGSDELRA